MFVDFSEIDLLGEIDFFVMYWWIGFIIIEVKVIEKFKINRYFDVKK